MRCKPSRKQPLLEPMMIEHPLHVVKFKRHLLHTKPHGWKALLFCSSLGVTWKAMGAACFCTLYRLRLDRRLGLSLHTL